MVRGRVNNKQCESAVQMRWCYGFGYDDAHVTIRSTYGALVALGEEGGRDSDVRAALTSAWWCVKKCARAARAAAASSRPSCPAWAACYLLHAAVIFLPPPPCHDSGHAGGRGQCCGWLVYIVYKKVVYCVSRAESLKISDDRFLNT